MATSITSDTRKANAQKVSADTSTVSVLDQQLNEADVDRLYELILRRAVGNSDYRRQKAASGLSVAQLAEELLSSAEFDTVRSARSPTLAGKDFLIPRALSRLATAPRKVLLIGSCAFDRFYDAVSSNYPETEFKRITFNNASALPPLSDDDQGSFDFQLVQMPIRSIFPEHMYLNDQTSEESAKSWLTVSKQLLELNFEASTAYCRDYGVQTFVVNFPVPQQNPLGRLQNYYSICNPIYYVEELNRHLSDLVAARFNTHIVDAEQISRSLGKRFIQDDSVVHFNHGSTLTELETIDDENRIEHIGHVTSFYNARVDDYNIAVYETALSASRSISQIDAVKLVIFDLDDTLWRGVAAERLDDLGYAMTEGWPLGILEAASFLMKRGIMIAIVSKNDDANVVRAWQELYQNRFPIENFVGRRVSWSPKAEGVGEIIALANVGPDAVLFVDDNPVERAHVREAFPTIRTLDQPLSEWRRILLWSSELQPAVITDEAKGRASSIRSKADRDAANNQLDPASFLSSLSLRITPELITDTLSPRFARCFELINKTNQFNTTGKRWTEGDIASLLDENGYFLSLAVEDRYASYGIVGIAIIRHNVILQYLMSCRVFGMQIEQAALALACRAISSGGYSQIEALLVPTEKNHLTLGLFSQAGFRLDERDERWKLPLQDAPDIPKHITMVA